MRYLEPDLTVDRVTVREIAIPLVSFVFNTDFIIENIFAKYFWESFNWGLKPVKLFTLLILSEGSNFLANEKEQKSKYLSIFQQIKVFWNLKFHFTFVPPKSRFILVYSRIDSFSLTFLRFSLFYGEWWCCSFLFFIFLEVAWIECLYTVDKCHKNSPMNIKALSVSAAPLYGPRLAFDWILSPVSVLRRPSLSSLCPRWDCGGRLLAPGPPPLSVTQSHIAVICNNMDYNLVKKLELNG